MHALRLFLIALLSTVILSCGGSDGGSSGDSSNEGTKDTGTVVTATIVPATYDLDFCTDTTDTGTATLNATSVNADLPSNTLSTDHYTVTFTPVSAGAPVIAGGTFPDIRNLPASGFPVAFISSLAKQAMRQTAAQSGVSSAYYAYTATYKFSGGDLYGSSWSATGTFNFSVGRYSNCPVTIYPPSATVTAIANPDADTSDDLSFNIAFGTGPYTVYSDNSAITAPGALGVGVSAFTVDPDVVDSQSMVTLTVVDSVGAVGTVNITIAAPALAVTPSSATVIGLNNPDGDVTDDLLFAITGGTGAYIVYSDNPAITAPGALGAGVASFTVDPVSVASDTAVTLTVVDSVGASATAQVRVTP